MRRIFCSLSFISMNATQCSIPFSRTFASIECSLSPFTMFHLKGVDHKSLMHLQGYLINKATTNSQLNSFSAQKSWNSFPQVCRFNYTRQTYPEEALSRPGKLYGVWTPFWRTLWALPPKNDEANVK